MASTIGDMLLGGVMVVKPFKPPCWCETKEGLETCDRIRSRGWRQADYLYSIPEWDNLYDRVINSDYLQRKVGRCNKCANTAMSQTILLFTLLYKLKLLRSYKP